jgi:hypothetical protein
MKDLFSRRRIIIGGAGVAVVAAAGLGGHYLLHKRYAPSPYDDLLSRLDDRDADAQIGEAVLANIDDFDAKAVSANVRARLEHNSLAQIVSNDAVQGHLVEAKGWVIPETLGLLCALAAKAAA